MSIVSTNNDQLRLISCSDNAQWENSVVCVWGGGGLLLFILDFS
jgi:hypothetical protein